MPYMTEVVDVKRVMEDGEVSWTMDGRHLKGVIARFTTELPLDDPSN